MFNSIRPNNMSVDVQFENISLCPICNTKICPEYISGKSHLGKRSFSLYCECTSCGKPFVAYFSSLKDERSTSDPYAKYVARNIEYLAPIFPSIRTFDNEISSLSPAFVEIYNQALSAESYNLNQISGIGYRKSLEFLIKDFLINHEHMDATKVSSTALGNCINTMIDNPQLKTVASRATWLGNDQTHYEQKYTDKDITDLKRLIDLSVHWISLICLTDDAELIEKK